MPQTFRKWSSCGWFDGNFPYLYRVAFNKAVDIMRERPRESFPADVEQLAGVVSNDWKRAEEAQGREKLNL